MTFTLGIAVNRKYVNKLHNGDGRWGDFNNSFENLTLSVEELIEEIRQGHAITSPHRHEHVTIGKHADGSAKLSAYRHSANWIESWHLGLDHDDRGIEAVLSNDFIANYASFVHSTASHKPDAPGSRSIFILDRPIGTVEDYAKAATALTWYFDGVADSSCKDAARLFFGAKGCEVQPLGNILPLAVVGDIIERFKAALAAEQQKRRTYNFDGAPPELQQVRAMLRVIPKHGDYQDHWLKVLMAVQDSYPGADGIALCEEWSPGYPGEIERKFKSFQRGSSKHVTIASLVQKAKQYGYRPAAQGASGRSGKATNDTLPSAPTLYANAGGSAPLSNGDKPVVVEPASTGHKRDLAKLGYSFALNLLDDVIEVNGNRLDDSLAAVIRMQMRDLQHKNMGAIEDTYTAIAYENRHHPIRRYLDGLTWDGSDQFGRLCSHVKDKHEPIVYKNRAGSIISTRPVFRVWLYRFALAAVARVYQRRVQNHLFTLDGGQGLGKSRLAAFIGSGLPEMFLETPVHPDNVEHHRFLATRWIWEIAELGATTRRADREALKAFITKGEVTFRKPYGRHPISKPALASFIGTINDEAGFLTDPTGNRRFLIVTLDSIDWKYEKVVAIDQFWAQIVNDYRKGESWDLRPEEKAVRDGMNKGYERSDPIEEKVAQSFNLNPSNRLWFMFTTEIADHLRAMGAKDADQTLYNGIGNVLRRLGLTKSEKKLDGQRARGYYGIRKKG